MPGIVCIISDKPVDQLNSDIEKMISCMLHENFYQSGKYINKQLNVLIGWITIKDSFADCMPVVNNEKDLILIFNGENFIDASKNLSIRYKPAEVSFSNAAYLIHLYEEEGENFVKNLNGWFNGILIDLRKDKILIFNDRFGLKRLYYYSGRNELIFSSEAKAILAIREDLKQINLECLGEYFAFGCVLDNKTLFKKIEVLPGGSLWVWKKSGNLKKRKYFKPNDWEQQQELDEENFYSQLKTTFKRILPRYFHSGQQVAISLTGGLDTRALLSYNKIRSNQYTCYTFGGIYQDCYDIRVAKKISHSYGKPHSVLPLENKFFEEFDNLAEKTIFISDGCHDICGAHDLYFNKLAMEIAPVRLTGKFGSEVLRGASTFKLLNLNKRLFNNEFHKYIDIAKEKYTEKFNHDSLAFKCFEEIPNHEYGKLTVEQSQLSFRTPYMDNDFMQLLFRKPKSFSNSKAVVLQFIIDLDPNLLDIPPDLGFKNKQTLITKIMHLNRLFSFKTEWYFNEGMPHWLSYHTEYGLKNIEKKILGKHKIDHYRKWFKENLASFVKDVLFDDGIRRRPFWSIKFLEEIVNRHLHGKANFIKEINKAVTVELIYRQLIE